MNNNRFITIGITSFNESRYLLEAWNSVLNQTSDAWQAVLVLDGCGDQKTKKYFESIQHPRLKKFYYSSNQGAYKCRTKAIELSDTEWYIHLDSDDLLPCNVVELVNEIILNNSNIEFIAGGSKHFSDGEEDIRYPSKNIELLAKAPLFCGTAPISKKLFYKIGGYFIPNHFLQCDWDFWLSIFEQNIIGFSTNDILYERRNRTNSVTWEKISELEKGLELIIKRHPLFFHTEDRKLRSRLNLYNNVARQYKTIGERKKSAFYAKKAIKLGVDESQYSAILEEESMTPLRYILRRIGRLL